MALPGMSEDSLKTFFSPALVRRLAGDIARVHPAFPSRRFVGQTCAGLADLELLDRGRLSISFVVRSRARTTQSLLVDVAVHFVKATGRTSRQVFKLKRTALPQRGRAAFRTTVSLKVHTTRKPQPGVHDVDVIVNGMTHPIGSFRVIRARE